MKICVLIPVHNEGANIESLVKTIRQRDVDVIVVNDGSTDNSGEAALSGGAKVITNEQRKGKGQSLRIGFDEIDKQNYQGLIAMDGDGQHSPDDLDHFLKLIESDNVSIINGNRMDNHQNMPFLRYWTNWLMSLLISSVCGQRIPDTQCGFRYIGCDVLRKIKLSTNDFEIETEILIKASKAGIKICSIPIKTIYGDEKSHIHPIMDTFRFIKYFLKELFSSDQ